MFRINGHTEAKNYSLLMLPSNKFTDKQNKHVKTTLKIIRHSMPSCLSEFHRFLSKNFCLLVKHFNMI